MSVALAALGAAWIVEGSLSTPARADYQRGVSLAAAQLWPEATAAWIHAIRDDPSYVPAYRRLAALYEQQHDLPSAIAVWHDLVKHVPKAQHAWCRLAEDEAAYGLTGPALKDAETELRQDNACPVANLVAGQLLARTSLQAEALTRLKRAAAAYPANSSLRLLYARLLAQDFHPAEAAAELRPLLAQKSSRSPQALYWMAYSLNRSDPPSRGSAASNQAELDLKQALAAQPQYPEAAAELGWLYQSMGRPAEAIPYLQSSLAERPHQAAVLYTLANALRQSGRTAEVEPILEKFRLESALNAQEAALQKQYAVSRQVATALQLARVEQRLQNTAGAEKVLDEASLDHPGDASIRALRLQIQHGDAPGPSGTGSAGPVSSTGGSTGPGAASHAPAVSQSASGFAARGSG